MLTHTLFKFWTSQDPFCRESCPHPPTLLILPSPATCPPPVLFLAPRLPAADWATSKLQRGCPLDPRHCLFQPSPHAVPLTVLSSQPCLHLSIESYSWPHCLSSLSYTSQPNCPNTCPVWARLYSHCSSPCPPTPVLLHGQPAMPMSWAKVLPLSPLPLPYLSSSPRLSVKPPIPLPSPSNSRQPRPPVTWPMSGPSL